MLGLSTGGCFRAARGPCDTPPPLHVRLAAAARINPDAQGQPLPTAVELLQLKGLTALEKADFAELLRAPKEVLGDTLLRVDELRVDPGQSVTRWVERDPKTTHLVAVGVFRQPSGSSWRAGVPIPLLPTEQCLPQQGERTGPPTEKDLAVRFFVEESRISTDARPTPLSE